VFADASQVDATDLLQTTRAIKTNYELGKLRVANEIAELGMTEFLAELKPGMTEVQVARWWNTKSVRMVPVIRGALGARLVRGRRRPHRKH